MQSEVFFLARRQDVPIVSQYFSKPGSSCRGSSEFCLGCLAGMNTVRDRVGRVCSGRRRIWSNFVLRALEESRLSLSGFNSAGSSVGLEFDRSVVVRNERVDSDGWREKEKRRKTATDTNPGEILRAGEGGLIGPSWAVNLDDAGGAGLADAVRGKVARARAHRTIGVGGKCDTHPASTSTILTCPSKQSVTEYSVDSSFFLSRRATSYFPTLPYLAFSSGTNPTSLRRLTSLTSQK